MRIEVDEQKAVEAPKAAPKRSRRKPKPKTLEDYAGELNLLLDRAKADGVAPLDLLKSALAKRTSGFVDRVLAAF